MAKELKNQVVVVTGASSGIGRETALQFARAGANVVLVARNEEALRVVADQILADGGHVLIVRADVGDWGQMQEVAQRAIDAFGRIDTWVNNAGVSIYARAEDTSMEETERIMRTNFMGMVHGVNAALPHMKRQKQGAIINVGSVESQRALPLQAVYSASKHAIKGYTEALRVEQRTAKTGVDVTLILPSGVNTPLFTHARSKIGVKPMPVSPAYSPELVARSILSAAREPQRDIYVGGAGYFFYTLQRISPGLTDKLMNVNKAMFRLQTTDEPHNGIDNLFEPVPGAGRVHGEFGAITKPSFYTPAFELSPRWLRKVLLIAALPISLIAGLLFKKKHEER